MIHFLCICGEPFDVPAELAGDALQCPACLRLVDVPRLGDADAFADDGTVRLADAEDTPTALGSKFEAFGGRGDMRPSLEQFLLAGTGDPSNTPTARPTPRYDPLTGELMLPVGMQGDDEILPAPPAFEPGAQVLGYARSAPLAPSAGPRSEVNWWTVPFRLLTGMSIVAILVVFTLHAIIVVGLQIPGFNVFFALPAFVILLTIAAHYANTVEDFGPNDKDRVPVLLRGVSFSEDIAGPLFLIGAAAAFSFGPLLLLSIVTPRLFFIWHAWVMYAALAWGLMVFPIAVLTTVCGGVVANLKPKRLASVFTAAPIQYVMAAAAFWAAAGAYLVGLGTMHFADFASVANQPTTTPAAQFVPFLIDTTVTTGIFGIAVFLMHVAATWLGLIYRGHHDDFDWVMQRHERVYRQDTMSKLMRRSPKHDVADAGRDRLQAARGDGRKRPAPPQHSGFEVKF